MHASDVITGVKNITDLIALLLGHTGKWDVIRDAIRSKDDSVRRIAIVLALAPPVIATLACLYFAVAR